MLHADYCRQFIPSGGVVLDVGSGRGKFLCIIAGLGFEAFGVETNPKYIAESEALAKKERVSIKVVKSRGENLPFLNDYFDFVNCAEVTEHVDNPNLLCQEIFRVLRSGGHCYISFHNRFGVYDYHYRLLFINWLPRSIAETVLCLLRKQKTDGTAGHQQLVSMHYYTYSGVKQLLGGIGFMANDIREMKIRERFRIVSPFILTIYRILLRPLYFNSFHFLLEKFS